MKKLIFLSIFITVIIIITGCDSDNKHFKLKIKESSWSDSMENYKPKEVTNEYDVVLGKKYNINSGNLVFKVEKINANSIVIKTEEVFYNSKKGINLNRKKKIFKIYINKETKLTTLTMDAGEIYYLKLTK